MGNLFRTILFATDFSGPSRAAQQYAVQLADKLGATLHAFHAVSEDVFVPAPDLAQRWWQAETERARKQLAADLGTAKVVQEVRQGNAIQEILKYADDQHVDLIVIGTHGRTGLSRMLLGSVAEKVVRLSKCPVLTVPPIDHQFVMDKTLPP